MTSSVDRLAAQQKREDIAYQDPQRIGGQRTVPIDKFGDRLHTEDMPVRTGNTDHENGATPPRGTWRTNRVHPVHRPRGGRERDALARAVEPFLDDLTIPQREATRLVVFGQLSLRQAAGVLGVTHVAVLKRVNRAAASLRPVIEQRSGSAGLDFPPTRPFDERAACRVRPRDGYAHNCDGHFEPAVCDAGCITILPRHYNAHTTCRVHTRGKPTRYEFNLAWLIGVGLQAMGGQTRRTRRPVRGRPNREGRAA